MITVTKNPRQLGEVYTIKFRPEIGEHCLQPVKVVREVTREDYIKYHLSQGYKDKFLEACELHGPPPANYYYYEVSTD